MKIQHRDPEFSELENAIVEEFESHGHLAKRLAVQQLRTWENEGKTPEDIAAMIQVTDEQFGMPTLPVIANAAKSTSPDSLRGVLESLSTKEPVAA